MAAAGAPAEGIPVGTDEPGWEMGAEVHVQDKKLVDKERVWAKGKVVGVEGEWRWAWVGLLGEPTCAGTGAGGAWRGLEGRPSEAW